MEITFRDDAGTDILNFYDTSTELWISDKVGGVYGARENQQYPFSNFKTYTIMFEVLDSQWEVL
jgi:frataxin-like iron-binding protein CyaY